jgi:stearoyl-CoA desaturase (Delta-9 desaturase)
VPFRLPATRIDWVSSSFLIGTALATFTVVPWYLWTFGIDWFQIALFLLFFCATGLSITLGYHRLFAHFAFKAKWPVKLATLVFGAAAFENTVIEWASDHRKHHKHTDHDDDPYDISKGFWHAHIGWILFKLNAEPPIDNVPDLERDPLVRWQHRNYLWLALFVGFVIPAALGYLWNGWEGALGGFLLAGVARVTAVQHMTFFINSLCHTVGNQPYSTRCSARDSWVMAIFTFGEGYHNYHHEFQHDYRNGVKWWQWDPTKWTIWTLEKLGLVSGLRRVPEERILLAQVGEAQRKLAARLACPQKPVPERLREMLEASNQRLAQISERWDQLKADYASKADGHMENARAAIAELRKELELALELLDSAGSPAAA